MEKLTPEYCKAHCAAQWFEVGDTVVVRSDIRQMPYGLKVVDNMVLDAGQPFTVRLKNSGSYQLIDKSGEIVPFRWQDYMLEPPGEDVAETDFEAMLL